MPPRTAPRADHASSSARNPLSFTLIRGINTLAAAGLGRFVAPRLSTRAQNERKYGQWFSLRDGGRRYELRVNGRYGWTALYVKIVDANENTLQFWQEIHDPYGQCVEIHEKFPLDSGHRKV